MKKLFIILLLGLLSSCTTSKIVADFDTPNCRQDPNCTITGIHDHIFFNR